MLLDRGWQGYGAIEIFTDMCQGASREYFRPIHECAAPLRITHHRDMTTFLQQSLSALHYMHERQVWHRNMKPENILYRLVPGDPPRPHFYVTDLGAPVERAADAHYMAPETMGAGMFADCSDMYAFGIAVLGLQGVVCVAEFSTPADAWRRKLRLNEREAGYELYRDAGRRKGEAHDGCSRLQSLRRRSWLGYRRRPWCTGTGRRGLERQRR